MNITYICNEYPPRPHGGIGTFVYYLARHMVLLGHKVTVAGAWDRDTEIDDGGIRVVTRATKEHRLRLVDRSSFHKWLIADVRESRTDIIEVPEFDGMLPFRFDACPVALRLHQSATGVALGRRRLPLPTVYWREWRTLCSHPYWIAVSQFVLDYTRSIFPTRPVEFRVIYNFAPPLSPPDIGFVNTLRNRYGDFALYVGKLTYSKGAVDLAKAARLFLHDNPQLSLVYVGRDFSVRGCSMRDTILNIVGPDLTSRVHFVGGRPHKEISAWMTSARVFIQPSHLEAFSLTALEAMHCGVPVVCTGRAFGRELITPRANGLLVDPGNTRELADAVNELATQPSFAHRLVQGARDTLRRRFSLQSCAANTLAFYQMVIDSRKTAREECPSQ